MMYYVYMLRCAGGVIYTGITNNVNRRMSEHFEKKSVGAKFTRSHTPEKLEAVWSCNDKSSALRLEARIKKLKKQCKEQLIADNTLEVLGEGFGEDVYKREWDHVSEFVSKSR